MKSKFAPLVKLKKEQLEEAKRALMRLNAYINEVESELVSLKNELNSLEVPSGGTALLFSQYSMMTQSFHQQIRNKKEELYRCIRDLNVVQDRVNRAYIEYEKYHYLQKEEERALLLRLKKKEALELDEIAVMGYNLQQAGDL